MQPNEFPKSWQIDPDWNPNDHLIDLKGRAYLTVQNRLLWFLKDQRALIVAGLAKVPYIVQTDLVEMDRDTSWAHFKTFVRDVLGNEATMYGSESAKDFADYAEKASTKSLGRALLALGYGTNMAPEMDEGERVVDSPVERRTSNQQNRAHTGTQRPAAQVQPQDAQAGVDPNVLDLSKKRATPEMQADLVARMRDVFTSTDAAEGWLLDELERNIRIDALKAGNSNITIAEIRKCLAALHAKLQEQRRA